MHVVRLDAIERTRIQPHFARASTPSTPLARAARARANMSTSSAVPLTLATFDVDGTLIRASGADANKFHKDAFAHGLLEVYGIDDARGIDVVQHHGSTDMLIVAAVARFHGVPEEVIYERMDECTAAMSRYAVEKKADAAEGLELLVGVRALLEKLGARDDVAVCLVTGNLAPIGWAKMQRLGIDEFFTPPRYGGFGSDHTDRGELVAIAANRTKEYLGVRAEKRFHFGDTPADVKAAEFAGATAIGLLTGIFSKEELVASSKLDDPIIFDDLSDTAAVVRALGLEE